MQGRKPLGGAKEEKLTEPDGTKTQQISVHEGMFSSQYLPQQQIVYRGKSAEGLIGVTGFVGPSLTWEEMPPAHGVSLQSPSVVRVASPTPAANEGHA